MRRIAVRTAVPVLAVLLALSIVGPARAVRDTDTSIIWSFTITHSDGLVSWATAGTYTGDTPFVAVGLQRGSDYCQQSFPWTPNFTPDYTSGSIEVTLSCEAPWPASVPVTLVINNMTLVASGRGAVKTEMGPQKWEWMRLEGGTTPGATVLANTLRVTELAGKGITGGEWPSEAITESSLFAGVAPSIYLPSGNRLSMRLSARARDDVLLYADLEIYYYDTSGTQLCSFYDRLDASELSRTHLDFATGANSFTAIPCTGTVSADVSMSLTPGAEFWRLNGSQLNDDGTRTKVRQRSYYAAVTGSIGTASFSADTAQTEVGLRVTR